MGLSTAALAYMLLKRFGISEDELQLVKATFSSFPCECIKKQLKAIYSNTSLEKGLLSVKVKPILETKENNGSNKLIITEIEDKTIFIVVVKEGIEVKKIRMQNVHGSEGSINNEEK